MNIRKQYNRSQRGIYFPQVLMSGAAARTGDSEEIKGNKYVISKQKEGFENIQIIEQSIVIQLKFIGNGKFIERQYVRY